MSRQKNVETQASVGSIVACPSCSDLVAEAGVSAHLDECLARGRDLERETRVARVERDHYIRRLHNFELVDSVDRMQPNYLTESFFLSQMRTS